MQKLLSVALRFVLRLATVKPMPRKVKARLARMKDGWVIRHDEMPAERYWHVIGGVKGCCVLAARNSRNGHHRVGTFGFPPQSEAGSFRLSLPFSGTSV